MAGFLKRLFGKTETPTAPAPLVSDTLFVFAGTFASELVATDYAFGLNTDASLSGDLGGATIGSDDVEIIFGSDRITASRPMLKFTTPSASIGDANTFFLLADRGYDPALVDGERVTFVGKCSVS